MRLRMLILVVIILATASASSLAGDIEYDLDVFSHYVWRGITFTDGPAFQPSVTTSHSSGFVFNAWGNIDLDDVNGYKGELNEIDLTFYFERGKTVVWRVGFVEYVYPNTIFPDTRELFVSVGGDVLASPEFTVYYDIGEVDDFYAMLSAGQAFEIDEYWASELRVSAGLAGSGFASSYSGGSETGFHDVSATWHVTYSRSSVTMSLLGAYTHTLDEDVLPRQEVGFWGGVRVSLSF